MNSSLLARRKRLSSCWSSERTAKLRAHREADRHETRRPLKALQGSKETQVTNKPSATKEEGLQKNKTMEEYQTKLKEFESLLGKDDEASTKQRSEIVEWLKANGGEDARKAAEELVMRHLHETDNMVKTIRQQLGDKYELLPISYIARHYFGKSASWLHQRINGYRVRGKVYTLNEEQKKIFNDACQDIARQIGSFHYA